MNPITKDMTAKVLQILLIATPWLSRKFGLSQGEIEQIVTAAIAAGGGIWSLFSTFRKRQKLETAKALPRPLTEVELNKVVGAGQSPSVMTPANKAPQLTPVQAP